MINKLDMAGQAPLKGLRVLDLGTMIAGPVAATLLADFGAEVIKIEQPKGGDPLRQVGPQVDGEGLYWQVEGRNKQSVTVDLRKPEGQALLRDLATKADVLVENFRPGTMANWNLGYETLREANPKLVMLSISGFGQTGPYSSRPAYDRIALAFGGLLNMTGYADRPPVRPGNAMADYQSAILGAFGVMVALHHRDQVSGLGEHVDLSLYETVFRFTDVMFTAYEKLGVERQRQGNRHFAAAPGDHYEMKDGKFIVMTVSNDQMFRRLTTAMNQEALASDPRFNTHAARWSNIDEINGLVAEWVHANAPVDVFAALERVGMAYSLVYQPADILNDPHYAERRSYVSVTHPRIGDIKIQAAHPKMASWQPEVPTYAPELGAATDAVLSELLGLDAAQIGQLRDAGVI